jgi:hypothetical protein
VRWDAHASGGTIRMIFTVDCGADTDLVFSAENGKANFDLAVNDGIPPTPLGSSAGLVGAWTYTVAAGSIPPLGLDLLLIPTVASPTAGDVTIWVRVDNGGNRDIDPNTPAGETHSHLGWKLGDVPNGQFRDFNFTLMCA